MQVISSVLPVIALLLIGIFCRSKEIISESGAAGLQSLVLNVTLPVALFTTFFRAKFTVDTLGLLGVCFVVSAVGYPLGRVICRMFRQMHKFVPFFMTSSESGMIGYTLISILVGQDNITYFAVIDLGLTMAYFIITYQILTKELTGLKTTPLGVVKNIFTTPLLVGMFLGIVCSVTGISTALSGTAFSEVLTSLCTMIASPTNAVILIVIGYRINVSKIDIKSIGGVIAMRLVQQCFLWVLVLCLFHFIGGIFTERLMLISVLMMMLLPCTYLLPMWVEPEAEKEFYSSVVSSYTVITIIGFVILAALF